MRKLILILGDVMTLYLALFVALLVRYGTAIFAKQGYIISIHLWPFTIIFVVWLLVLYIAHLYEVTLAQNTFDFYSTFGYALILNAIIAVAFFYFIPLFLITPKTNLFIFLGVSAVMLIGWRYYINNILRRAGFTHNTLIIGANQQTYELHEFLRARPQMGFLSLGVVNIHNNQELHDLEEAIRQRSVDNLILSPDIYAVPHIIDMLYRLSSLHIKFFNLSDFFERLTGKIPLEAIDQVWFLQNLSGVNQNIYESIKRCFDTVLAFLMALITLPLYPFIIVAIKLDSQGPAFYTQWRVGKSGVPFKIHKFRTMTTDAESKTGPVWASEHDTRSTRVGRFLRKTRIDELPQIADVLLGNLSFVGPRPERPEFHDQLKANIPFYEERYLAKPGLTGWAQIKYKLDFKGGLTVQDTVEKLKYDLYYIKNRSIFLDIAILLKTIAIILKKLIA